MRGGLGDTLGHKSVLDKQRAAISKLRDQNQQLKADLLLENKFSVQPSNQNARNQINRLQDEDDFLARKVILEMRRCKMFDQQLGEIGGLLSTTRTLMGGIYSAKDQSQSVQKQIKILENRLEQSYVKYNQAITYNRTLREQINNLRRERIMFESINQNLERELQQLKADMAEMIQMAAALHTAKDKAMSEVHALKLQSEKEHTACEEEWKALTAMIEEDKRSRERARAEELAVRKKETDELLAKGVLGQDKKKKLSKGQWNVGFNKALAQNVAAEKVQMYGQAFEAIQQATGIDDIDKLVGTFMEAEDHNYTVFNYVNEVNAEIEKLEDQITTIRHEIEKYTESGIQINLAQTQKMKTVESHLDEVESTADLYDQRLLSAGEVMACMKTCITTLFESTGCNTPAVQQMLGEDGVTDSNILGHLGIIEQRANELLQAYAMRGGQGEEADALQEALIAQPLQANATRPYIVQELPSTSIRGQHQQHQQQAEEEDDADGEEADTDEIPLSREALSAKIMKSLPKKLETAIKLRPNSFQASGNGKKLVILSKK